MTPKRIYEIDDKKFIASKAVRLHDTVYTELVSLAPMRPEVAYIDPTTETPVEDWKTYSALREKYVVDRRTLRGKFVMNTLFAEDNFDIMEQLREIPAFKDEKIKTNREPAPDKAAKLEQLILESGKYWNECVAFRFIPNQARHDICHDTCHDSADEDIMNKWFLSDFFVAESTAEINKYFEGDIAEFSANAARGLGHLLRKHGIPNAQQWFAEKMRGKYGYAFNPLVHRNSSAACSISGKINFASVALAHDKFRRAHEMAHKVCNNIDFADFGSVRSGLNVFRRYTFKDEKTGEEHTSFSESGRSLNEGVSNLLAEIFSGLKSDLAYDNQTNLARQLAKMLGKDLVLESALFNPPMLSQALNRRTGNETAYIELVNSMDENARLNAILENETYSDETEKQRITAQSEKELLKAQHIILEIFTHALERDNGTERPHILNAFNIFRNKYNLPDGISQYPEFAELFAHTAQNSQNHLLTARAQ